MDRCLCHGSSGVYIMFKYFNDHLFNGNLSECVNYWFDYTYNEAISNPDLYCKRFLFYNNETAKYELRTNILDGISGLGLGLISNSNNLDKLIFLT